MYVVLLGRSIRKKSTYYRKRINVTQGTPFRESAIIGLSQKLQKGPKQKKAFSILLFFSFYHSLVTPQPSRSPALKLQHDIIRLCSKACATSHKCKCLRAWLLKRPLDCFIYILDSWNSSSITFWTSQFGSNSRSNWTSIWTGNSNGSWTDKQSFHFSTAKEMSVKATFFFM